MNQVNKNIIEDGTDFYTSKEVKAKLKISGCKLMHLREKGLIGFKKKGNGYLYLAEDVLKLMSCQ